MGDKSKNFSIIDKGLTVEGTVSCKGQLVIKGTVKGTLEGEIVVIAEDGAAYADTKVASMTIGGNFEGKVSASEELIILSTGKCSGTVICKNLVVEAGGILNAEVSCKQFQKTDASQATASALK
ncbi:MAG: polymer-forming cytoskeletal protein [Thermodesulfobacteriota bacterium]